MGKTGIVGELIACHIRSNVGDGKTGHIIACRVYRADSLVGEELVDTGHVEICCRAVGQCFCEKFDLFVRFRIGKHTDNLICSLYLEIEVIPVDLRKKVAGVNGDGHFLPIHEVLIAVVGLNHVIGHEVERDEH